VTTQHDGPKRIGRIVVEMGSVYLVWGPTSAKLFVKDKTLYYIKMRVNYIIFPILLHGWIMVDINP